MKLFLILFTFLFNFLNPNSDISMNGVSIHDSETKLETIKLEVVASQKDKKSSTIKYKTENGNDLSVTTKNGEVVFLENDWLQAVEGNKPLLSQFTFGETSLKDIRAAFGTNGFSYKKNEAFTTANNLIEFNCFELDSPNNEILVIVTKLDILSNISDITEENVAERLKLDAIIIADNEYLEKLWGSQKSYDPNYKKVKL
jgi:hypothetical protein